MRLMLEALDGVPSAAMAARASDAEWIERADEAEDQGEESGFDEDSDDKDVEDVDYNDGISDEEVSDEGDSDEQSSDVNKD